MPTRRLLPVTRRVPRLLTGIPAQDALRPQSVRTSGPRALRSNQNPIVALEMLASAAAPEGKPPVFVRSEPRRRRRRETDFTVPDR